MTTRLSPAILFGWRGKCVEGHLEAWCIAQMMCLVGGPIGDPTDNEIYKKEFNMARILVNMDHSNGGKLVTRDHWRKELEDIADRPVPKNLLDFLETLLVIDPDERPTAEQALRHPYLQSAASEGRIGVGQ